MPKKMTIEGLARIVKTSNEDLTRTIKTTNEDLARLVNKGFETMATKEDIKNMATKDDIKDMATKDDFKKLGEGIEKQIAKLRGDLVIIVRKEDKKLTFVINLLKEKKIFSPADLHAIAQIRVFPKIEIST